jgi:hypothetical protein
MLDIGVAFDVALLFFLFNFFVWWTSHRYTPAMQVFRMSIIEMLCDSMQCSYPVCWSPC